MVKNVYNTLHVVLKRQENNSGDIIAAHSNPSSK